MTIGLGIKCTDGVVLLSDTVFTVAGSHRFYDCKIYNRHLSTPPGWVSFTFAGDPDLMNMFHGKFSAIVQSNIYAGSVIAIKQTLEDILNDIQPAISSSVAQGSGLYTLCAMSLEGESPALMKTSNQIVSDVGYYDYVGVGDSSLIRYLSKVLFQAPELSVKAAVMLGTYLVMQAKAFVDGCGGETDILVLLPNGRIHMRDRGIAMTYEQRVGMPESHLNRLIASLCNSKDLEERFDGDVERFSNSLRDLCAY